MLFVFSYKTKKCKMTISKIIIWKSTCLNQNSSFFINFFIKLHSFDDLKDISSKRLIIISKTESGTSYIYLTFLLQGLKCSPRDY